MKNLLLLLLLANILYFLWGMFVEDPPERGVAILEEADLGPTLELVGVPGSNNAADNTANTGSGRSLDFESYNGRACATIGPFREPDAADAVADEFSDNSMRARVRTTDIQVFVGHWVQIRDVADDAAAEEMLGKLSRGGLKDAYLVRTEDEGLKISLGLFEELDRAEKVELEARSLDLPANIAPRMVDRTVHFVDIELPPGQGASAIVAEYGEEQVLLRNEATCPP